MLMLVLLIKKRFTLVIRDEQMKVQVSLKQLLKKIAIS